MSPRALALVPVLLLAACGPSVVTAGDADDDAALIGASACAAGQAPAAIAVIAHITRADETTNTFVYCTGTLIAPDAVLVAAHCITETNAERIFVNPSPDLLFLLDADEPTRLALEAQSVPVRNAIAHPDYDGGSHDHDVGLLLLDRTIDDIEPAIVIDGDEAAQLVEGKAVRMVGYGFDEGQIAGLKRCGDNTLDSLDGLHLFTTGSVQGCSGDSGGGLFLDVDTAHARRERVVGTASFVSGSGCVDFTAYAHVAADLAFLDGALQAGCDARAWCDVLGLVPASFYDPPPVGEGEGEGEGEGAEGEGEGEGDEPPPLSCASSSSSSSMSLAPLTLWCALAALRLRRRSARR